jgi:hypothetical protein
MAIRHSWCLPRKHSCWWDSPGSWMRLRHCGPASSGSANSLMQSAQEGVRLVEIVCESHLRRKEIVLHHTLAFWMDGSGLLRALTAARMMKRRGCFLMREAVSKIGSTAGHRCFIYICIIKNALVVFFMATSNFFSAKKSTKLLPIARP